MLAERLDIGRELFRCSRACSAFVLALGDDQASSGRLHRARGPMKPRHPRYPARACRSSVGRRSRSGRHASCSSCGGELSSTARTGCGFSARHVTLQGQEPEATGRNCRCGDCRRDPTREGVMTYEPNPDRSTGSYSPGELYETEQPDSAQLSAGHMGIGSITIAAIAAAVILGVVLYGLNSAPPTPQATAPAQTASSAPAAGGGAANPTPQAGKNGHT